MEEIPDLEKFKILRAEVSYEATLAVQRTAWFVAAQAFLFGSLATAMDNAPKTRSIYTSAYYPLIPILALIVCALTFLSVSSALRQAHLARQRLLALPSPFVAELFPMATRGLRSFGVGPTLLLPLVFAGAWVAVLLHRI